MRSLIAAVVALVVVMVAGPSLAAPCSELPVLFIVQDKSGSMDKAPDGTAATALNPSKWSVAQQVVPNLATQFANRFRFGAEMFPGATTTFNCTVGSVVAPVSNSPAGVQAAYAAAVAGGGTPTAVSLQLARTHLASLNLTTPAHVLLITDGLPNCNLALDPNSCTATTPGCANNACALGAKDCLDNNATVQAAQQLFAAGIKVFVVGFDTTLSAGNNKAVLDAVAAAGGTGSAYVATNQAQLASTLNTIALNTATCCRDACTAGAAVCTAGGQRQTCAMDPSLGCTTWTTTACPTQSACTNGTCVSCTNQCTAGALRCSAAGDAEQCVANAAGCTGWTTAQVCGYGELCTNGSCGSCQACTLGGSRCTATGVETCEWDVLSGCTHWQGRACASGSTCQAGSCTSCNSACTAGATRCTGKNVETCVANAAGCTAWQTSQTCSTFCSGGACGTCGTSCTAGSNRCNGGGVETCIVDANNCPAWGPTQQCAANSVCGGGICNECPSSCTQGAKRCTATGGTQECRLQTSGCTAWETTGQCNTAGGERCDVGVCIPPCHDECAAGATQCMANGRAQSCEQGPTGCTMWRDQPVCGADQQCVDGACRTHCSNDEFETCPAGQICTGLPGGRICLPVTPVDAGTGGGAADGGSTTGGGAGGGTGAGGGSAGTGGGTGSSAGGGGGENLGARAAGCGCNALDGVALPLLALAWFATRRRQVR